MMMYCGMTVKKMGLLGVSVRKVKPLTVKMETMTLFSEGRWNLAWFMYQVYEINSNVFSLNRFIFGGSS